MKLNEILLEESSQIFKTSKEGIEAIKAWDIPNPSVFVLKKYSAAAHRRLGIFIQHSRFNNNTKSNKTGIGAFRDKAPITDAGKALYNSITNKVGPTLGIISATRAQFYPYSWDDGTYDTFASKSKSITVFVVDGKDIPIIKSDRVSNAPKEEKAARKEIIHEVMKSDEFKKLDGYEYLYKQRGEYRPDPDSPRRRILARDYAPQTIKVTYISTDAQELNGSMVF